MASHQFLFATPVLYLLMVSASAVAADEKILFNRDVRPILSSKCFHCHGPDDAHREADLRFDTEEGIVHAFEGGLESEAWKRIVSDDEFTKMPPPDSHKELKTEEVSLLKNWVQQGAKWEGHWAFLPPAKPQPPEVQNQKWVTNSIDAFVLSRLENEGLEPNEEADRERLLRRVTFDLTGLPPTIDEIDSFLADESPDAYEKVVDRLLSSKSYGERMAVNWLDAARYGDTSVFHADGPRDMWPWRDWVIDSYNNNMPFDQFTVEQLAGDLIPDATTEQKLATGFLRNNATTDEGGAIAEEFRVEYAVDRVKTVSMVWLGLSMECAQCHSHKYDPITMKDYYSFFAYFNQASDPGMQTRNGNQTPIVDLFDQDNLQRAENLKPEVEALKKQLAEREGAIQPEFETWLAKASADAESGPIMPQDMLVHAPLDEGQGREVHNLVTDESKGELKGPETWGEGKHGGAFACNAQNFVDLGNVADFDRTDAFSYGCWIKPEGAPTGAPMAKMNDGNGYRGFDIHIAGGVVQIHIINTWPTNAIKVRTKNKVEKDKWQHVFVTYDGSSKAAGVKVYIDGKEQEWDIEQDRLSDTIKTSVPLYLGRRNPGSAYKGLIDDARVYPRVLSATEVAALAGADPITPILAKASDQRTEAENTTLRQHYLTAIDQPYQEITKQIASTEAKIAELTKPYVNVMVMKDEPSMRSTFVLERGNYASPNKEKEVLPNVPEVLGALPEGAPANRLGMAQWMVSNEHPLTARVAVNRYWAMFFGQGIVRTLEDFGAQGEWPTHPGLLDWMAVDFMQNGWNVKRMIKQIVMSSTYRQSARFRPEAFEKDPENQLLTRGPRFRLQGEFVRDNALTAAGLLSSKVGGPGVKPYQPPGLWNEVSLSGNVKFEQDHGENLYRRSLYTYWKRSSPAPAFTIFDAPTREKCTLRRGRTNTPLQALVTMNDTQYVEASRALAERVLKANPDLDQQITLAYRLVTGLQPTPTKLSILRDAYEQEHKVFQDNEERAKQLISTGEAPRDESLIPADHAAMTIVASLILNLDEAVTR